MGGATANGNAELLEARSSSDTRQTPAHARGDVGIWSVAAILILAASAKSYELAMDASLGVLHGSRGWYVLLIQAEYLLAVWLLSGYRPALNRKIGIAVFVAFAGTSLFKGWTGEGSCGCFGMIRTSPWLTAAIDLVAVYLLLRWNPRAEARPAHAFDRVDWLLLGAMCAASVVTPLVSLMLREKLQTVADAPGLFVTDQKIVLEPSKWIGSRLPIGGEIDIGERLATGNWIILIHQHDCSRCAMAIPYYTRRAAQLRQSPNAPGFALVDVPPYDLLETPNASGCLRGRLSDDKKWLLETPVELVVIDSRVIDVRTGERVLEGIEDRLTGYSGLGGPEE